MLPTIEIEDLDAVQTAVKIAINKVLYKPGIKAKIHFFKLDGSLREMIIIHNHDVPPQPVRTPPSKPRVVSPDVIRVYEDGVGWRSFVPTNFISIEPYSDGGMEG